MDGCNCPDKTVFNVPKGSIYFGVEGSGFYTVYKPKVV